MSIDSFTVPTHLQFKLLHVWDLEEVFTLQSSPDFRHGIGTTEYPECTLISGSPHADTRENESYSGVKYYTNVLHLDKIECLEGVLFLVSLHYNPSIESGVNPSGLRTHSCRRTAAYYASWIGIPESTIKVSLL